MTERERRATIDELLDSAVKAINRGDRATAATLAERVLAVDQKNREAEDLLVAPVTGGELRRLTLIFCDLVDSTALSTRIDPEAYRTIVGTYRQGVQRAVDRYGGHIGSTKGDGLLAVFGYPVAHENDVHRAIQAGLEITRDVAHLNGLTQRRFGVEVGVRVGVHRGMVYLDTAQDDVYGLAANLTARVSGLARPGTVVVSNAIEPLIRDTFDVAARPAQPVKGIPDPVAHYEVLGECVVRRQGSFGPMVGRDKELAYLRDCWVRALDGALTKPGVAFLGEPGIGKSRLAATAIEFAEQSGATVLPLVASPFHTTVGLHPVRTLLQRQCGIDRNTSRTDQLRLLTNEITKRAMDPDTMVPLLAPVLGIAAQQDYQPRQAEGAKLHEEIVQGVHDYIRACLENAPGLVLIEDLHWYDASTLEVVDELLKTHSGRLLAVITGRNDTKLPDATNVESFELRPLSDTEADELISALSPSISELTRDAVRRRCDGVPLYIEEVVASLDSEPTGGQVPDSLYESLVSRFRVPGNTAQVVEAAATIGREVDRTLLLSVLGMAENEVDDAVGALLDSLVLEQVRTNTFRFRHELLREVAYELAPPSLCRSLHGRIADALLAGSGNTAPDWRLVALHYDEAERFSQAARAYQEAAADARRRGALDESRNFLGQAIGQLERLTPDPARDRHETELRLRRGFLAFAVEGTASGQAAADFERCLELAGTEHSKEFFAILTPLYGYYATRGDMVRAEQVLNAVSGGLSAEDGWMRPTNEAGFAMIAWYRGEFRTATEGLTSAAERMDISAQENDAMWFIPNEPIASVYTHLAAARAMQGDFAGAEADMARAIQRAERVAFPQGPYSNAYACSYWAWINIEAGRLDRAAEIGSAMAEQAERHGFAGWVLIAATQMATIEALSFLAAGSDDVETLQGHVATMAMFVGSWRALEMRMFLTFYESVLARLLTAAGQTDEARTQLDGALALANDTGVHFYDAELLRLRAQTQQSGDARADDLRCAMELAVRQGAVVFEIRSAADDFQLRGEPARNALAGAIERLGSDSTWPELVQAAALLG